MNIFMKKDTQGDFCYLKLSITSSYDRRKIFWGCKNNLQGFLWGFFILEIIAEILNKKIKVKYLNKSSDSSGHYHITPYTFKEDISKKYTLPFHIDIGEGIIDIIKDIKKL